MTRMPVGDNEPFSAAYWAGLTNAHALEAVSEGLNPAPGAGDLEIDVSSGAVMVDGDTHAVDADTVSVSAGDGSDPRVDLITADGDNTVNVVEGTPADNPVAPAIPEGEVLIGAVYVPAGASSVSAAEINDYRAIRGESQYPYGDADVTTARELEYDFKNTTWQGDEIFVGAFDAEFWPNGVAVSSTSNMNRSAWADVLSHPVAFPVSDIGPFVATFELNEGGYTDQRYFHFRGRGASGNRLAIDAENNTITVQSAAGGSDSASVDLSGDFTVRLEWDGSTATVDVDGTQVLTSGNFEPNEQYEIRMRVYNSPATDGNIRLRDVRFESLP